MDRLLIRQEKRKIRRACWAISLLLSALSFLLFWPNILLGLGAGAGIFLATWFGILKFLQGLWEKHCNKVVIQLEEGLTIMSNSLKAGLGITQAMERVIQGYPGPLAKEFRLVLNKTHLGQSIEDALSEMRESSSKIRHRYAGDSSEYFKRNWRKPSRNLFCYVRNSKRKTKNG